MFLPVFLINIGYSDYIDDAVEKYTSTIDKLYGKNESKLGLVEEAITKVMQDGNFQFSMQKKQLDAEKALILNMVLHNVIRKRDEINKKEYDGVSVHRIYVSPWYYPNERQYIYTANDNVLLLVLSGNVDNVYVTLDIGGEQYRPSIITDRDALQEYQYVDGLSVDIKGSTAILFGINGGIDEVKKGKLTIGKNEIYLSDIAVRPFIHLGMYLVEKENPEREICNYANQISNFYFSIDNLMGSLRLVDRIHCQAITLGEVREGMPQWLFQGYNEVNKKYELNISSSDLGDHYCKYEEGEQECLWLYEGEVNNVTTIYY